MDIFSRSKSISDLTHHSKIKSENNGRHALEDVEPLNFILKPGDFQKCQKNFEDSIAANSFRQRTLRQRKLLLGSDRSQFLTKRRLSHDEYSEPRTFFVDVDETLEELLKVEDTNSDYQITVEDKGPKVLSLTTSNGHYKVEIRGNYMLSNLLQELSLEKYLRHKYTFIDEELLNGNPVTKLNRRIKTLFWDNLTRSIQGSTLEKCCYDPKDRSLIRKNRLYVPYVEDELYSYYQTVSKSFEQNVEIIRLPEEITLEYIRDLYNKPGLLALGYKVETDSNNKKIFTGLRFVTPGSRFNEQYGWDSYFIILGLLQDDKVDLAIEMVDNLIFQITHYKKILNANRTYYLARSQPPFLTDLIIQTASRIEDTCIRMEFLERGFKAAIREYFNVWMTEPRLDKKTGLSRYRLGGIGIPPETEASHFDHVLDSYALKYGMGFDEFCDAYNYKKIHEPDLDTYFMHDRGIRESGHDTTSRFTNCCGDLATIDLNSLLYKYEVDIAYIIKEEFNDNFRVSPELVYHSSEWIEYARSRKLCIDKYLWSSEEGMFFDYNSISGIRTNFESATTFWTLWAGLASPSQAEQMVKKALPKFEKFGGIVSNTYESILAYEGDKTMSRQWDYPTGWAPHQILTWKGLLKYGYEKETFRLVYRWLYIMVKTFSDYNGIVVEKYNVVDKSRNHIVNAEYGNQGLDFRGMGMEGFGWSNASFQIGLSLCNSHMKRALGAITSPVVYFR